LHAGLARDRVDLILRKGRQCDIDSYGAFVDDAGQVSGLTELLKARGVSSLDVVGLATDYCVGNSALQAAPHFRTRVLLEGCRGVGLKSTDIPAMLQRLSTAGVELVEK
jgi:nicotinamidase/pyrazinamidase